MNLRSPADLVGFAREESGVVRIPGWDAFPWLRAGFSTRQGGLSTVYSDGMEREQNLGWTAADSPSNVAENRRRFVAAVAREAAPALTRPTSLVTLRQIHSGILQSIDAADGSLATPEGKAILEGDGLLSRRSGLLLGVQTADCVPVLLADTRTHAVAAFHAGWRGTLARIVERGAGAMQQQFGSHPSNLIAAIGPAIRPCCFAIGEEVRSQFQSQFAYAEKLFSQVAEARSNLPSPASKVALHMDLHEANRQQLIDAGLPPAAITIIAECTACERLHEGRRKYFSHRAEQGFTGRMLSVIGTIA